MYARERSAVKHWVREAIVMIQDAGRERAFAQISDPGGPFIEGGRYVFALSTGGELLAHPFSKQLLGKNLAELRDSEGTDFIRKLLDKAKRKDGGFVEYKWPVPGSEEELHKETFFVRVDGVILCSGFYTSSARPLEAIYRCFQPYGPA